MTRYGDSLKAWASRLADSGPEWLELTFSNAVVATAVRVRQVFNPGAVNRIEVFDAAGVGSTVFSGVDTNTYATGQIAWFVAKFPRTAQPVQRVRISLDSARVKGWNEIDAVQLVAAPALPTPAPTLGYAFRATTGSLEISDWPAGFVLERATRLAPSDWQSYADHPPVSIPVSGQPRPVFPQQRESALEVSDGGVSQPQRGGFSNSPGQRPGNSGANESQALKGRNNYAPKPTRRCAAFGSPFQGWRTMDAAEPRALPWAGVARPFGAGKAALFHLASSGSDSEDSVSSSSGEDSGPTDSADSFAAAARTSSLPVTTSATSRVRYSRSNEISRARRVMALCRSPNGAASATAQGNALGTPDPTQPKP